MALTDDLVSYWKLDEASGNALDAHGAHDLTETGTVGSAAGKISTARNFTAPPYTRFSKTHADFTLGDIDFTIQAWVYPTEFTLDWEFGGIVCRTQTPRDTSSFAFTLSLPPAAETFRFIVSNGSYNSGQTTINSSAVSLNTWYHVVAWHDSVNNEIGMSINNGTPITASRSTGVYSSSGPFLIGSSDSTGGSLGVFVGRIDEVAFWKRVLTSEERASLYNDGDGLEYPLLTLTSEQEGYRFFDDDGSESASTGLDSQDTAISRAASTPTRVRVLTDYAGDPASTALKLQWKGVNDPATEWRDIS